MSQSANQIMGPHWSPENRRFPILVKWLDCEDRLSLQVHPPAHVAKKLNGEPKTECWFIVEAKPNAKLFVGLKDGVSKQQFQETLLNSGGAGLAALVHRTSVNTGESILLESGRIHAIDAGNLILEIQQNSDTTYRVYDWDRVGLDGQPRQLHVDQSLQSIDFGDFEPALTTSDFKSSVRVIADCDVFRIRQLNLQAGESFDITPGISPSIISVVHGDLEALNADTGQPEKIARSENVLCPFVWGGALRASSPATILLTDQFNS